MMNNYMPRSKPSSSYVIGVHTSTAGGLETAADRARQLGCNALQIFSSSPRQWRGVAPSEQCCAEMRRRRVEYGLKTLVIHANYLINLAGFNDEFHQKSQTAFRGELERAAALGAEYLVLHPGSSTGGEHGESIRRLLATIRASSEGFDWKGLTLLIENTAGGGNHLGGNFEEVAEILEGLRGLPVAACLDTCHCWAAGYDLVSAEGFEQVMTGVERILGWRQVPVLHLNDSKGGLGSHLDRHEHIGAGQLGGEVFRRLLREPRLKGKTFILETPVDGPEDQRRDLEALRALI